MKTSLLASTPKGKGLKGICEMIGKYYFTDRVKLTQYYGHRDLYGIKIGKNEKIVEGVQVSLHGKRYRFEAVTI